MSNTFSIGRKAPLEKAADQTDTRYTRAVYLPLFYLISINFP
jgi:hypothetical protein